MKTDFNNADIFAQLEDKAIDGNLNYSEYPSEEYKYFSKLSQLGYKNRHDGWSFEICMKKQEEYKKQYLKEKDKSKRFSQMATIMQENIRKGGETVYEVYKANTNKDRLHYALMCLEKILCEDGLEKRVMSRKVEE